jgi:hypothetical protein
MRRTTTGLVFTLAAMRSDVDGPSLRHARYASTCTATATLLLIIELLGTVEL